MKRERTRHILFWFSLTVSILFLTGYIFGPAPPFGPFPVKGPISDSKDQVVGMAKVYPRYVEIFDRSDQLLGKVGIFIEQGYAKLFIVEEDKLTLVGYGDRGKVYNIKDEWIGYYYTTPTYSFIYDRQGNRKGKVKCIAWPRVCAAGVSAYLLQLLGGDQSSLPEGIEAIYLKQLASSVS